MSLGRCIPGLVAAGKLHPDDAQRARGKFDEHRAELEKSMAPAAAEAEATRRALTEIEVEDAEAFRREGLQVKAQQFAERWLTQGGEAWGGGGKGGNGFIPGEGPKGPVNPKAARAMIRMVDARRQAIEGQAFAKIEEILHRHRVTLTGKLRRPAEMDEIGRAAFGEEADSVSAKELAEAVAEMQEWLRLRANAAGANIAKLERRGFATHHDSRKVAEAGFEAWYAAERPRWDLDRMIDEATGQPFTDAKLLAVTREAQATIASDGFSKRKPGSAGRLSFANRMGQHRFIHYKSYADWKASQEQFGRGTAFDALLGEVKGMSRAIAAMEILGPNPEATVRFVRDRVEGDEALFEPGQLKKRDLAAKLGIQLVDLWREYTGALRQPENRRLAVAFSSYRAIASSAKLGSAALTATSDVGFGYSTRRFNGLPAARIMGDYLKLLNPADSFDRRLAAQLSFVPETWVSQVAGQHRFLAQELTGERAQRVADGVLRASGLNAITDAGRQAHGLVTFIHLTNTRDQTFDALEPAWRAALERYRIGEKEWDAIRKSSLTPMGRDILLITPDDIADQELATRFLEMAHSEQDFAVPVPDIETRTWLNKSFRKGDWVGEIIRSSPLMFKTFTVSSMLRHGGRTLQQPGLSGKMGHFIGLLIPLTIAGVFAQQLQDIFRGRDPRPLKDPSLWWQGLLRSGGLGIVGDLLGITAEERYMSWPEFVAGPQVQDAGNVASGLYGLGKNAADDSGLADAFGMDVKRDDRAAWKLYSVGKQNLPGQNVWYLRRGLDFVLGDLVQQQIDPNYRKSRRAIKRRAAEHDQGLWWEPGELSPERPPDLSNAFEGGGK